MQLSIVNERQLMNIPAHFLLNFFSMCYNLCLRTVTLLSCMDHPFLMCLYYAYPGGVLVYERDLKLLA